MKLKPEIKAALAAVAQTRREVLKGLDFETRLSVLEHLLHDFFVEQTQILSKWAALTGQTAQIDSGYAAQHVASILLSEPGQGFRGKGLDLANGGEVKSAAALSGVDRPRWNHNFGTISDDAKRRQAGKKTKLEEYLAAPLIFYLLFDQVYDEDTGNMGLLRIRGWLVDIQADEAWRGLVGEFEANRRTSTYNLQLHPPVGYDDDIVVNTLGNLDFSDVKMFEIRLDLKEPSAPAEWVQKPPESYADLAGRTKSLEYTSRPSHLAGAADIVVSIDGVRDLLPEKYVDAILGALNTERVMGEDASEDD